MQGRPRPTGPLLSPPRRRPARWSRPGARCRHCCWSVSPGRSPNPACGSHRTGLSMVPAVVWVHATVKGGLHPRYPPPRTHPNVPDGPPPVGAPPFGGPSFGITASTAFSTPLPPFALRPALPDSTAGRDSCDYYGGSAPPRAGQPTVGSARGPSLAATARAGPGWFPCSLIDRSTEEAPDSAPATSPWLPRSTSPRPPHRYADPPGSSPPP
jgi:hypothetical protein